MTTCRVCRKESHGTTCPYCGTTYDNKGYAVVDFSSHRIELDISWWIDRAFEALSIALILVGIIVFFLAVGSTP